MAVFTPQVSINTLGLQVDVYVFSSNSDNFGKKLVIQFFYNMQVMYILGRLLTGCQWSFQADNRLTDTHVKNNMAIRRILVQKIKIQVYWVE